MYMHHPSLPCNKFKSFAMKSAPERAAYLRQHPAAAAVSAAGSRGFKEPEIWRSVRVEGSLRRCAAAKAHDKAAAHLMQQQQQL
jgi:hypothetical protein